MTRDYTFPQLMQLTSRFHFLIALGLPGSGTAPFSKYIQFQCNCGLFWKRCACHHALLLGTRLQKKSGGFDAKIVRRRIPSRVGLGKRGKERAKEYCRLARPLCPPKLSAGPHSEGVKEAVRRLHARLDSGEPRWRAPRR